MRAYRWGTALALGTLVLLATQEAGTAPATYGPAVGPHDAAAEAQRVRPGFSHPLPGQAAGPCLTVFTTREDAAAPFVTEWVETHMWDAAGHETARVRHSAASGTTIERRTWTYDAAGRVSEEAVDTDGNGAFDQKSRFTWDAQGRLIKTEALDGSGQLKGSEGRLFDAQGRLVTIEARDAAGTVTHTTTLTCDASGRPLSEVSGDWRCETTWKGKRRVSEEWEGDRDDPHNYYIHTFGPKKEIKTSKGLGVISFQYDTRGRLVRRVETGDGTTEGTYDLTYDAKGNLLREDYTVWEATFASSRTYCDYGCWPL